MQIAHHFDNDGLLGQRTLRPPCRGVLGSAQIDDDTATGSGGQHVGQRSLPELRQMRQAWQSTTHVQAIRGDSIAGMHGTPECRDDHDPLPCPPAGRANACNTSPRVVARVGKDRLAGSSGSPLRTGVSPPMRLTARARFIPTKFIPTKVQAKRFTSPGPSKPRSGVFEVAPPSRVSDARPAKRCGRCERARCHSTRRPQWRPRPATARRRRSTPVGRDRPEAR